MTPSQSSGFSILEMPSDPASNEPYTMTIETTVPRDSRGVFFKLTRFDDKVWDETSKTFMLAKDIKVTTSPARVTRMKRASVYPEDAQLYGSTVKLTPEQFPNGAYRLAFYCQGTDINIVDLFHYGCFWVIDGYPSLISPPTRNRSGVHSSV